MFYVLWTQYNIWKTGISITVWKGWMDRNDRGFKLKINILSLCLNYKRTNVCTYVHICIFFHFCKLSFLLIIPFFWGEMPQYNICILMQARWKMVTIENIECKSDYSTLSYFAGIVQVLTHSLQPMLIQK